VRVEVHDQGGGVPPEAGTKIFDKFETARRREGTHRSTGLGLTFCKLAIEAHGGAVGVDSGVPVGSVFWFELPASISDIGSNDGNGLAR
jgi:signal transduction histidine kinase